jgi:hypothetical protein
MSNVNSSLIAHRWRPFQERRQRISAHEQRAAGGFRRMNLPIFDQTENRRFRKPEQRGGAADGKMFPRRAANLTKNRYRLARIDANNRCFVCFDRNFRALSGFHFSKKIFNPAADLC